MGLGSFFGFKQTYANNEIPNIFPMSILEKDFVATDVKTIYTRILTDAIERTDGITDEVQSLLWDNCLASESSDGLVTMLACAMVDKKELFLVYDKAVKVLRRAKFEEQEKIRADYLATAKSAVGFFITFKNYTRSDMLKIYSSLEYCTVASLNKGMKLSTAIQLKLNDLRSSVGAVDSDEVKQQAVAIAKGLADGRDVMLDGKDTIESAKPDLTATNSASEFIETKRAFYLGMPCSYLQGETSKGLGDSGDADSKATERGLKQYYFSIVKPTLEAIFEIKTSFKSDDFDEIDMALNVLKTFEITNEQFLSAKNKQLIVNRAFGLPDEEEGDGVEDVPVAVPVVSPSPVNTVKLTT